MKKLFVILLLACGLSASAQTKKQRPCMPSEGYWVVESNVKTPKESTVYFYTSNHDMIYKESISGKRINIKRKKTVLHLNAVLMQSLTAWNNKQPFKDEEARLVKAGF